MAKNDRNSLRTHEVPLPISEKDKKVMQEMANSPEGMRMRLNAIKARHESALNDIQGGRFATLKASRSGTSITVTWDIAPPRQSEDYYAVVTVWDVDIEPSVDVFSATPVSAGNGVGSVTLDLQEGHSYNFFAAITQRGQTALNAAEADLLMVNIAIPLSPMSRKLLEAAKGITTDPKKRIEAELGAFRIEQDAFEKQCRKEVERIKAKGLSPEEEQEQIEDFMDYARTVRNRNRI